MQLKTTIQAGTHRGQPLQLPPHSLTRAVSAKVRAAVFNTLGDVQGLAVLDLYAGGGTLGLEALSQGAAKVTFVDSGKPAIDAIKANVQKLGVGSHTTALQKPVEQFLASKPGMYDVVFFDPPYAEFDVGVVARLADLVQLGGVVVLSSSSKTEFAVPTGFELVRAKLYGDTKITYLRKI